MLELIGGGRLGTAVKKGFLIGGKKPPDEDENRGGAESSADTDGDGVRAFCIEWAGM